jgi:hypothetical protein
MDKLKPRVQREVEAMLGGVAKASLASVRGSGKRREEVLVMHHGRFTIEGLTRRGKQWLRGKQQREWLN